MGGLQDGFARWSVQTDTQYVCPDVSTCPKSHACDVGEDSKAEDIREGVAAFASSIQV